MEALKMAGVSAELGSHCGQAYGKLHRRTSKRIEKPKRDRRVVPMEILRRPKSFDHQERGVSVFEELTQLALPCVEATHEGFRAFRDERVEGGPSSRKSFDGMAFGQEF